MQEGNNSIFSVDPVTTIRQHYLMLLQQGRTDELDQLTNEILAQRANAGQVKPSEGNAKK